MDVCSQTFVLESLFLAVEDCAAAGTWFSLTSWLLECTWTHLIFGSESIFWLACVSNITSLALWVLSRSWHIELQTLTIENLIIIESWWCLVKANVLAGEHLVVRSSTFRGPLSSIVFEIVLAFFIRFNYVLDTLKQWIIAKFRRVIHSRLFLWIEHSNFGMGFLQWVKSICCGHEYAIGFRSFFFRCGKCSGGSRTPTFNTEIKLEFFFLLNFDQLRGILAWIRSSLWLKPWICKTESVWSERTKFNALFLLLTSVFFVIGSLSTFQTGINWIIDVNIGSRSRIWSLRFLVYRSGIAAVKGGMHSFFLNYLILDIILFLLVIILTRSRILGKCLPSIRSLTLMLPEFASFGLGQERLRFLAHEHSVWIVSHVISSLLFNWMNGFISSGSRSKCSSFGVLAIGHFWLKHLVLSTWIELFLALFVKIIYTWTWVTFPAHIIMSHVCLFKYYPLYFAASEIILWETRMYGWNLRVICCWTNLVKPIACISCLGQFLWWNTRCLCIRNDCQVFVFLCFIFISGCV